jgi:signal transduction histidine kinase
VAAAWVSAVVPAVARDPVASLLLAAGVAVAGWWTPRSASLGRRAAARSAGALAHSVAARIAGRPVGVVALPVAARIAGRAAGVLALGLALPAAARLIWPGLDDEPLLLGLYCGFVSAAGLILLSGRLSQAELLETDVVIELTEQDDPEQTLAALRREEALRQDPESRAGITAAAGLLEANLALHADLADKVGEVRASRRRLVEAADAERHRLEQRLAGGAERYLDELTGILRALRDDDGGRLREPAEQCLAEVDRTRADLGRLARGLHPRALAEHGLPVALAELAERSPVPASLAVPDARFPAIVEATVWYACAEAMANVAKYAQARTVAITVRAEDGAVVAHVRDDGVGGAAFRPVGGLTGLADRLSAVDGELAVTSPPGGGTRLWIRVPL